MPDLPIDPRKIKTWESSPKGKGYTTKQIIDLYSKGYAGASFSPEAKERFLGKCSIPRGEDLCRAFRYEESGKGQLIVLSHFIEQAYPDCLPGGGQVEGDCVSWSDRNSLLANVVMDFYSGIPDEVSGKLEILPKVSEKARKNGVFSTEACYAFRSTKPGHGWFCHESAEVGQTKAGLVLRMDYSHIEGGINLEVYNSKTVNHWNRKNPTRQLVDVWDDHLVRDATEIETFEALRDMLFRGFGIHTCGSESFALTRDEHGVCKRTSGGWAHAMAFLGCDDRPWAHRKYGGPLILVQNSWKEYLKGPREIYDPPVPGMRIPPGSFWARWKDVARRVLIARSGANGWQRKPLPDYSTGIL
jgi:hypothetical protein